MQMPLAAVLYSVRLLCIVPYPSAIILAFFSQISYYNKQMCVLLRNLQQRSWVVGALAAGVAFLLIAPPLADRFFGNGDGRFGFYSLDTLIPIIIGTLCAAITALLLLSDSWLKNLAAMLLALFFCFCFLEIFLRIYDPFQFRFHFKEISLPHNVRYIIRNKRFPSATR